MKVKDLLNKYNGEFYIYENVYNEHGNLVDNNCIASHAGFRMASRKKNKIMERKVHDFSAGHFFLNIYLEDETE